MESDLDQHLKTPTSCRNCNGGKGNLKLLPCLHSICMDCLQNALDARKYFKCPVDGKIINFHGNNIHCYPDNFLANNYFDYFVVKEQGSIPLCRKCYDSREPVVSWCSYCSLFLCQQCLDQHVQCRQQIYAIDYLRNSHHAKPKFYKRRISCPRHSLPATYFCEKCQQLVCKECQVADHTRYGGHVFRDTRDIYEKYRFSFQESVQKATDECKLLSTKKDKLTQHLKELRVRHQKLEQGIDEIYEEIIAHITAEREKVKCKLHKAFQIQTDVTKKDVSTIEDSIKHLQEVCTLSRDVVDEGSHTEFLSLRKQLSREIKERRCSLPAEGPVSKESNIYLKVNNQLKAQIMKCILGYIDVSLKYILPVVEAPTMVMVGESTVRITHFWRRTDKITVIVKILDPHSKDIKYHVQKSNEYTSDINFRPQTTGKHRVSITIKSNDENISNSEQDFEVLVNEPVLTFGGEETGNFNKPMGIICANEEVLVAGAGNGRVQIASQEGEIHHTECLPCTGITVTPDEQHIITVGQNSKHICIKYPGYVHKFTHDQFQRPYAVAADHHGHLFVADGDAGCVFMFTLDGTYIRQIGSKGDRFGQLQKPCSVTVNDVNEVAVCDLWGQYIQWYDMYGRPLRRFGSCWGSGPKFDGPRTLCIDNTGYMLVLDGWESGEKYHSKIMVFTSDEKLITEINGGEDTRWVSMAVSNDGHVFVTDYANHKVIKYRYR
ncbi:E3 ubiquitin-protein ligase TRIM71-like [Glandiceps talaboti]